MNLVRAFKPNRSLPPPPLPPSPPPDCACCDDTNNTTDDGDNNTTNNTNSTRNFAHVAISVTMSTWHRCRFIFVGWPIEIWLSTAAISSESSASYCQTPAILFTISTGIHCSCVCVCLCGLRTVVRMHRTKREQM